MTKRNWIVITTVGGLVLSFQNCAKVSYAGLSSASSSSTDSVVTPPTTPQTPPSTTTSSGTPDSGGYLSVTAAPSTVPSGSASQITAVSTNLTGAAYACVNDAGTQTASGSISLPASSALPLTVTQDMNCTFVGTNSADPSQTPVSVSIALTVDCGSQVKTPAGTCEDFTCKSIVALTGDQLAGIPARTDDGVCYTYQLLSAIASSSSNLTTTFDDSILARNHGRTASADPTAMPPFLLGRFNGQFKLLGARTIKLAGSPDASTPILVDNFILTGVYPSSLPSPLNVASYYQVNGTSDAGVLDSGGANTGTILFNSVALPVNAFASGGTSTIAPLNITAFAQPNILETLDVRALDCGGSRDLSDIYLLFQ